MQQFVSLSPLYWLIRVQLECDRWLSVEKTSRYIDWYYEMNGDKSGSPPTPTLIAGKLQMELRPNSDGCVSLIKVCHGSESAYTTLICLIING